MVSFGTLMINRVSNSYFKKCVKLYKLSEKLSTSHSLKGKTRQFSMAASTLTTSFQSTTSGKFKTFPNIGGIKKVHKKEEP